jgi:Zn-dependent protease
MVKFSSIEVRDLVISMVVISLAFAIFFRNDYDGNFLLAIPATLAGVVPGFLFHELAHKFMAIKYGFDAEFKMYMPGLFMAFVTSFLGIIFAAPGAVHIKGDRFISMEEDGKIAIVGPLSNILLAFLFLALIIVTMIMFVITTDFSYDTLVNSSWGYLVYIGIIGFTINGTMAAINMIPWSILDGASVYDWNKKIWGLVASISFIMAVAPYILMYGS